MAPGSVAPKQQPVPLALVWGLAAAWILPGLLGHDPWKPDASYTFGLIYSALKNGDWLVPMLAHEPFMEKPALSYWSAAAMAWLLSPPFALPEPARLTTGRVMALTSA